MLQASYATTLTSELAAEMGRTSKAVYLRALSLGVAKSPEFVAASSRERAADPAHPMHATKFIKGQPAWNVGLRGVVGVQEACRATQFKAGYRPQTWVPVGTVVADQRDGVLRIKVSDTGNKSDWKPVHVYVWERDIGPVPDGCVVVFKLGQKTTEFEAITADILECVTRSELMRRNSRHTNYPPEINRLMQLRGAITRQINKRSKEAA